MSHIKTRKDLVILRPIQIEELAKRVQEFGSCIPSEFLLASKMYRNTETSTKQRKKSTDNQNPQTNYKFIRGYLKFKEQQIPLIRRQSPQFEKKQIQEVLLARWKMLDEGLKRVQIKIKQSYENK